MLADEPEWPVCPDCAANSLFEVAVGVVRCMACGATFAEEPSP